MTTFARSRARRLSGLLAACFVLVAAPAAAQDPPPPLLPSEPGPPPGRDVHQGATRRTLKGHVFLAPFLIDTAFVTTHFGLGAEIGHQAVYGVLTSPFANSTTGMMAESFQFDASVGVTNLYGSFGVAVSDRVEIGADASYTSLLGTDVNTAILYGGQSAWALRPGVRFQLLRSTSSGSELGLHLYGNFGSGSIENPQAVLTQIASQVSSIAGSNTQLMCLGTGQLSCAFSNFDPQTATHTTNTVAGAGATLALAQAVSRNFGLQFALGAELGRGWSNYAGNEIASTPFAFHVGVAPSYSFGPTVPITLMGEYLFTVDVVPTQGTSSNSMGVVGDAGTITTIQHGLVGGVYFTGKSDLQVGALFTATFTQSAQSLADDSTTSGGTDTIAQAPTTTLTGQLNARYYF